jgi:ribonuclease P protein component
MDETLKPRERIKKKKDFNHLYKKGKRYRGQYFTLVYLSNEFNHSRLAVVASKKLGNAVTRNKTKRWMRDLFRRNKELLKNPTDLIIIPHRGIHEAGWQNLLEEYRIALTFVFTNNHT